MLSQQLSAFVGQSLNLSSVGGATVGTDGQTLHQQQQQQQQSHQQQQDQSFFPAATATATVTNVGQFDLPQDAKPVLDVKKKKPGGGRPNPLPWQLVGVYETLEAMDAVRCTKKVSKRKSDHLKAGVKMSYRCNGWKRYKCPYKMYAMCPSDTNQISLHEAGKHDHSVAYSSYSGKNPAGAGKRRGGATTSTTQNSGGASSNLFGYSSYPSFVSGGVGGAPTMVSPSSAALSVQPSPANLQQQTQQQQPTQQQMQQRGGGGLESDYQLTSLMATFLGGAAGPVQPDYQQQLQQSTSSQQYGQQQIKTESSKTLNDSAGRSGSVVSQSSPSAAHNSDDGTTFSLSDGPSVQLFLQIARSLDLNFHYQPRQSEYIITTVPNQEKQVVFEEIGQQIKVTVRANTGEIRSEELWMKADYNQFFWAVRGKCAVTLK